MRKALCFIVCLTILSAVPGAAQRNYAGSSVLASGNWFRIAVKTEGVYKIDVPFLTSAGIPTSGLSSASIRLYGNGGRMLDEDNAAPRADDLRENPIEMNDGGDGLFNGADYFLFYAPGPHQWLKDSLNQSFRHQKNLYSDTAYYYICIGGAGKRIQSQTAQPAANVTVTSFSERYFYESDLVNFLNSGKEWYGEEFNGNLGGNLTRSFTVDWPGFLPTQPVALSTDMAARNVGAAGSFAVRLNGQQVQGFTMAPVTGNFLDPYVTTASQRTLATVTQSPLTVAFTFSPGVTGAQGWLNWFELQGRRTLQVAAGNQLSFRDWPSVSPRNIAAFQVANGGSALSVWEVTEPLEPVRMLVTNSATTSSFTNDASRLREYIAFTPATALTPVFAGRTANQDLHHSTAADLLVITHTSLLAQAQRLAAFHTQHDGYTSNIVTTDQVYNEFSSGTPDPAALRDYVKMFYDRAAGNSSLRPKYLLLMGGASFDYRNRVAGNSNLVPGYESPNSTDPLLTFTSDDFFGLLDDADDIAKNDPTQNIDIGIGRIPARNAKEAAVMTDKIIHYYDTASLGPWRNQSVYVADDGDANLHLQDAEIVSADAAAVNPQFNPYKIYLDAYPLVSSSAGARYPAVNDAIVNQVFNGTLFLNYSGHGSYQRLAEEAVVTQEELNRFNNPDRLPLFITASCDFAPHDDPTKASLGSGILTGGPNGAIALLTTTRLVFAYSNRQINDNYLKIALKPGANGQYLTLGESVQQAKNATAQSTGDVLNNRKFTLLGDPAMRLGFPKYKVALTTVNGHPLTGADTLKALGSYTFEGMVTDAAGNLLNFNGKLYQAVYDKAQPVKTLGNDPSSIPTTFSQQASILYKGNVTVTNGRFRFSFIMPKDINYQPGPGRISLYASDGVTDAGGVNTSLYVGGAGATAATDHTGPVILPYLNDDQFRNGGLTNENPVLLARLSDSSGISTSGSSIGHDITVVIDGNERNVLVLNNFYTADLDSYQRGTVLYQLPALGEGKHTLRIKAWDVADNSGQADLDFVVVKQAKLEIANVRAFPNPFSSYTTIGFEHNQPNTNLDVNVMIFSENGALVKQFRQVLNTGGTRNCQLIWNGDNQSGAKLPKGLYIYKIMVAAGGVTTETARQVILF